MSYVFCQFNFLPLLPSSYKLGLSISQSISNFYSGLSIAAVTARTAKSVGVTQLGNSYSYNIWVGLLEQVIYQLAPKGPQRISQHNHQYCYVR